MWLMITTFLIPLLIGFTLGFCLKGFINRYEKRRAFDRHLDEMFTAICDKTREIL